MKRERSLRHIHERILESWVERILPGCESLQPEGSLSGFLRQIRLLIRIQSFRRPRGRAEKVQIPRLAALARDDSELAALARDDKGAMVMGITEAGRKYSARDRLTTLRRRSSMKSIVIAAIRVR